MGQQKKRIAIVREYVLGGESLRELALKYGISSASLHRWVKSYEGGEEPLGEVIVPVRRAEMVTSEQVAGRELQAGGKMPEDVKELQRELKEAQLYNKLLNAMIDIAEEQMGVPIRKKPGAKR